MISDDDHKVYNRMLNEGRLPWEMDAPQAESHPVFVRRSSVKPLNPGGETERFGAKVEPLSSDFMPEATYIEWLEQHYGIPPKFALQQLPDFKLYWMETGEARKAWQNKFKNHVIYQWKRKQSENEQNPNRTTVEKLTDTSWSDSLDI